jgi:hypothetical protein
LGGKDRKQSGEKMLEFTWKTHKIETSIVETHYLLLILCQRIRSAFSSLLNLT